jgi:methylthioribose-1-phosphate isomerase
VTWVQGLNQDGDLTSVRVTPIGVMSGNPAFDVTPAHLVSGILTEHGVYQASSKGLKPLREKCR